MKIIFFYLELALIFFNLIDFSAFTVDAADPFYEACKVPKSCGNQTINFPFYIQGQQQPYCGYPGFNISCDPNGRSILNLSGQNYVVRQIFYQNDSFLVSNAAFLDLDENDCIPYVRNLTLSTDFQVAKDQNRVVLLYNCQSSSLVGTGLLKYRVGCYAKNDTKSVLAFYESDNGQLANTSRMCGTGDVVVAETTAAEGYMGSSSENEGMLMREVVRRGFMLTWLASDCKPCESSGGRCGFLRNSYHFKCFCPDRPHNLRCFPSGQKKKMLKLGLGLGIALGGIGIIVSVILIACRLWKKHQTYENFEATLKSYGPVQVRRYSYSNIKKMTNSFTEKLGQGGFGDVFKGRLDDGRLVAVKVLKQSKGKDAQDFINEVATISRCSHVNIVTLLGFCFEGPKRALIYEFMPNGSLEKFIFHDNATDKNTYHLDWETYNQISLGIARGLEYLHRGCNTRILHFDIKPHNILLDVGFVPKISDFGLARICNREESHVSMFGPRGTIGYIAPEVYNRNFGGISHKSDVYSYGMMVLEMIGGRKDINIRSNNTSSETYFPHWIYRQLELDDDLELKRIMIEEDGLKVKKMIIVSLWCIQTNPSNRPTMSQVIEMLEGSVDSLKVPPKPFLYSPSPSSESTETFE